MMDRTKAEMILTDVLAGESSAHELDELYRYETSNIDLKECRESLEIVWGLDSSESFKTDMGSEIFREKIRGIVANAVSGGGKGVKLSLDSLDLLSAAGTGILDSDNNIDK